MTTLVACHEETLNQEKTEFAKETQLTIKGGSNTAENTEGNELVILYPDGTTEAEKVLKRAEYNIESYKKCECADPHLELWIFSKSEASGGGLEDKKATARADEEIEGAEYNPNIRIQEEFFVDYGGFGSTDDALLKRVASNQGVTVAVLDTGIMYDYEGFTQSFLYNSSNDACTDNGYQELFGWNFVDENNNPYDNHYGRHGTMVSSFITSTLDNANVNYQILPVKVADQTGNIRYFDALCGFQYAANKADVDISNMSFGWYTYERELMEKFINDAPHVLVITSAGNDSINNDNFPHYPSSYESDNLLAIASLSSNGSQPGGSNINQPADLFLNPYGGNSGSSNSALAIFSNRGVLSVDIAATGEYIPFTYNNEVVYVSGTSYAAAFASGYSGTLSQNGMSGVFLKNMVIESSIYNSNLYEIQYAKHIPH